jgi:hypothetical protein
MPKIDKVISLEISPEQYLNSCSALELQELEMLIQSPRFRNKMNGKIDIGKVDTGSFMADWVDLINDPEVIKRRNELREKILYTALPNPPLKE